MYLLFFFTLPHFSTPSPPSPGSLNLPHPLLITDIFHHVTIRCIGNVLFPPLLHYSWASITQHPHRPIFFNNQYTNTTKNKEKEGGGVCWEEGGRFSVINLLRWQFSLEHSLGKKWQRSIFSTNLPPDKVQEEKEKHPPPNPTEPPESIPFPEKIKKGAFPETDNPSNTTTAHPVGGEMKNSITGNLL